MLLKFRGKKFWLRRLSEGKVEALGSSFGIFRLFFIL